MTRKNASSELSAQKKKKSQPDFATWAQSLLQAIQDGPPSKQPSAGPLLSIVATPIGNLGDISLRALWALSQADAVLCEDTRVTGGLLHLYGLKKPLVSCHDHNEEARVKDVLNRLEGGQSLALVSDAGTPMISDPGYKIVRAVRAAGFPVVALPGASALLTAIASGGLPTDRFLFVGFLPPKASARRKALADLAPLQATLVFYESPNRLSACLSDMAASLGAGREAVVARELTKLYEEIQTGTLGDLAAHYAQADTPKGEIVILVQAASEDARAALSTFDLDEALRASLETMSLRDAVASVTKTSGLKRSEVYARALTLL